MLDPLADAQAWYDRAQEHISEYRHSAHGEGKIWGLHSSRRQDGTFEYSLRLDRALLTQLKPIACETANALFQSLDNIVATAARDNTDATEARRDQRKPRPWTPWPFAPRKDDDPHSANAGSLYPNISSKDEKKLRGSGIAEEWLMLIDKTFAESAGDLHYIDVVKEVSNSGKHWELMPVEANALAIAWKPKSSNRQIIDNIPHNHFQVHDDYVFHEGSEMDSAYFQIVTTVKLLPVTDTKLAVSTRDLRPEPLATFERTSRFAGIALTKARRILDGKRPA